METETASNFLTLRQRKNPPSCVLVYLVLFALNATAFAITGWLLTRRTRETTYDGLARATSTLTLLNFIVICASIRHVGLRRGSVGRLFHESGSCYLFLIVLAHTFIEIHRHRGNTMAYTIGSIMFVVLVLGLILFASKRFRKYRYNLFYYTHSTSFAIWSCLSVAHSIYFLPIVLVTVLLVYGPRLLLRTLVPVVLMIEQISEEFVLIDLKIRKSRLTRLLLIDRLTENNGNSDIWLVCHNISYLERHPFHVIETRHRKHHVYVRVLVAKLGDWTEKLCAMLTANEPYDLFSGGAIVSIDHCRTSIDSCCVSNLRNRYRLLFLLRNEEIVVFLRYLVYVCDPRNERCRDRVRLIFLHYSVTDLNYLTLLQEYLTIATTYKCVTVTTIVYTRHEPIMFNGSLTMNDDESSDLKYENVIRTIDNRSTTTLVVPDIVLRQKLKRFIRKLIAAKRKRANQEDTVRIL